MATQHSTAHHGQAKDCTLQQYVGEQRPRPFTHGDAGFLDTRFLEQDPRFLDKKVLRIALKMANRRVDDGAQLVRTPKRLLWQLLPSLEPPTGLVERQQPGALEGRDSAGLDGAQNGFEVVVRAIGPCKGKDHRVLRTRVQLFALVLVVRQQRIELCAKSSVILLVCLRPIGVFRGLSSSLLVSGSPGGVMIL